VTPLEQEILAQVTPTAKDQAELDAIVADLLGRVDRELASSGLPGHGSIQGSVAKGTWLRGGGDIDLFLLLDPSVPADRLEGVALAIGPKVLESCQKRYAQHPYLIGTFRGRQVDLVPAYRVPDAAAKMSAVDRTPFHTAWVRSHLAPAGLAEVRLLKKWMKGVGVYGAQTAVGGFSGYLAEVLVVRFGSFHGVLEWLAGDARPRRIALGPDQAKDEDSPLVVVDPVDPARNCAAAVHAQTLGGAAQAARAYRLRPGRTFFDPTPPRAEPAAVLQQALQARHERWMGLAVRPRTDRLDIVFPQFQKASRAIAAALEEAGFPVRRSATTASPDESEVLFQWVSDAVQLPATRIHRGPPDDGRPNAQRFRDKWTGHPDAAGPVGPGPEGRLQVTLCNAHRTAPEWLAAHLRGIAVGRHVQEALGNTGPWSDTAQAAPEWAPGVADLVLDRRPWER
jgi:tRNA nucleotidyltransferase (CCA-adding enzyme)